MTTTHRAGLSRRSPATATALFALLALSACGSSTAPANNSGSGNTTPPPSNPPPASALHCAPEPVLGAAAAAGVANPQMACAAQPEARRS
ncbi:hypothetical protein [Nevskia soli]|uniref:hypothetical protein n=1 Tax=Nevskia soli TaxID=418856 RepID=UPI0012F7CF05|nr:hypothetical protein [Nevskia soli]